MKITKYFLMVSIDKIFKNNEYSEQYVSSTTSSMSVNNKSVNNNSFTTLSSNTSNVVSTALGITSAAYLSSLLTTSSTYYSRPVFTVPNVHSAVVDFFNCGLSFEFKDDNNFIVDGLLFNNTKYNYIVDTKTKNDILISSLEYTSFDQMFLDLTIRNLFEISEIEI